MIKGIMLHTQFNFQIVHKFELENGDWCSVFTVSPWKLSNFRHLA